jgi:predicted lipoprotein with Yx(FWY)xxD motif
MIRTRPAALLAATATLGVLFLSACGGNGYGSSSAAPAKPAAGQPAAGQSAGQPAAEAARAGTKADALRLTATNLAKLGAVVTDGNGMTLYRFDQDRPGVSNCYGACATAWPPMLAFTDEVQLNGIEKNLVGTITRKDGTKQVTIGRWPVYHYAKDAAPGDAKGQGAQGTWYAVTPSGKKASATNADSGAPGYDY